MNENYIYPKHENVSVIINICFAYGIFFTLWKVRPIMNSKSDTERREFICHGEGDGQSRYRLDIWLELTGQWNGSVYSQLGGLRLFFLFTELKM
jgi:hypothetical protein